MFTLKVEWLTDTGVIKLEGTTLKLPEIGQQLILTTKKDQHSIEVVFGIVEDFVNLGHVYQVLTTEGVYDITVVDYPREKHSNVISLLEYKNKKLSEKTLTPLMF